MNDANSLLLIRKVEQVENLARGSKFRRFLYDPIRYVKAIGFWRFVYPLAKKGRPTMATTFFGAKMSVVLPSATEIYLFGAKTHDSEIRLTKFLIKNLKPGSTFADVGAHFGYFTLLAAHLVGEKGQVFSFEASKSTFEILQKNTAAHPNIRAYHQAATDVNEKLTFHEFPVLYSEFNSLVAHKGQNERWMRNNPARTTQVEGRRLDGFFSEKTGTPDLIKIDVEGAEGQVLKGMEKILASHPPVIVMEYLGEESHQAAVEFAKNFGYQPYLIDRDGEPQPCRELWELRLNSDNVVLKVT